MRKTLSLVSLAVMPIALYAQAPASPSDPGMSSGTTQSAPQSRVPARPTMPDQPTMQDSPQSSQQQSSPQTEQQEPRQSQRVQAAAVSAELTKKVDTKDAKVGDEISIKTSSATILPDGPSLPRGTKLIGKVTDVQAKAKGSNDSHLAFSIERAVLSDGKEIPLRAAVASVTAPAGGSSSAPMSSAPSGAGGSSGGAAGSSGAGGGSSSSAPAIASSEEGPSQASQGGVLKSAEDRVPVGNLPGVLLTGSNSPESAGMLLASGKNIDLESGTKLILIVAAAA